MNCNDNINKLVFMYDAYDMDKKIIYELYRKYIVDCCDDSENKKSYIHDVLMSNFMDSVKLSEDEKFEMWSFPKIEKLYNNAVKKYLSEGEILYESIFSEDYPYLLKNIYDPPVIIYYKGNIKKMSSALPIAIVGSRKPDNYGYNAVKSIVTGLSSLNVCIVSGLALGIDSLSHIFCMKKHGYTVAVLGSPVDNILPKSNESIAENILKSGGAVISEYKSGSPVFPSNFSKRNRIIAGLSEGVVVIQAAKKSGSLITAKSANENSRNVFAVPGNIFSNLSAGTNNLIKQGATPIDSIYDILDEYKIRNKYLIKFEEDTCINNPIYVKLNNDCKNLISILMNNPPMSVDDLFENTNYKVNEIVSILNKLIVYDLVIKVESDKFTLTK